MDLRAQLSQSEDGRWTGELAELPGVQCSGTSRDQVLAKVVALVEYVVTQRAELEGPGPADVVVTLSQPIDWSKVKVTYGFARPAGGR